MREAEREEAIGCERRALHIGERAAGLDRDRVVDGIDQASRLMRSVVSTIAVPLSSGVPPPTSPVLPP